jgi:hypothetical protein
VTPSTSANPHRIQRQRTKGWRMPEGAVYVGRPSRWGNPFPWSCERATWMAVAFGERADEAGRRAAAVKAYRWWATKGKPNEFPVPTRSNEGSALEYTDGSIRTTRDIAVGMGLMMFLREPLELPPTPDLTALRGRDLACWCPLDQPCHADVLLELANPQDTQEEAK